MKATHNTLYGHLTHSKKELAELIQKIIGFNGKLVFNPEKPDGTIQKLTDISNLHALGWKQAIELQTGIEKMYRWYIQQG